MTDEKKDEQDEKKRGRPEERLKIDEDPEAALQKLFQPKDLDEEGENTAEDPKDPGDSADN